MRLPPTPCRVCFRPCVFNKFSHFWQKRSSVCFARISKMGLSSVISLVVGFKLRLARSTVLRSRRLPKREGEAPRSGTVPDVLHANQAPAPL